MTSPKNVLYRFSDLIISVKLTVASWHLTSEYPERFQVLMRTFVGPTESFSYDLSFSFHLRIGADVEGSNKQRRCEYLAVIVLT